MRKKKSPARRAAHVVRPPADRDGRTVALMRALGDPTRLEMFRLIAARREPICVCDVVERFDLGQPTISHHLKVLREAGLVKVTRKGVWSYYAADRRGVSAARKDVQAVLGRPAVRGS